jgi:lysophospholipase L1-like esterase
MQSELNLRIEEYSAIIKSIAQEEDVSYLAAYEAVLAQIAAKPGQAFTSFRFFPLFRDAMRALVLRKSPDEIAQINGWNLHTDGVHLNSRGAMIVADLIQEFIDEEEQTV